VEALCFWRLFGISWERKASDLGFKGKNIAIEFFRLNLKSFIIVSIEFCIPVENKKGPLIFS